jgi:hypothetical protein
VTDTPYGIDPTTLPPRLIEDINVITKDVDNVVQYHSSRERLRQFITPPPPECGWQPEYLLESLNALRALLGGVGEKILLEAIESLAKVRCTLPAGHHTTYFGDSNFVRSCCNALGDDPIHCGHEHRIERWVKP